MPRAAREKSKTGVYHIMVRGINRQSIFQDNEDKGVYLKRLSRYKEECGFEIYAYCLMDNHVHLLMKEGIESISDSMKRIGASYVYWYNYKYVRTGHLFQDRYRSEIVEDDAYLITVARYIHQNPVKVGKRIDYWTSYNDYLEVGGLTDVKLILDMLGKTIEESKTAFIEYMNEANKDKCLELEVLHKLTDDEARKLIIDIGNVSKCIELSNIEKINRDRALKRLKEEGISVRQLERLTGINRGIILRA